MAHRELTPADYIAMLRRRWILIVSLAVIGAPLAYAVSVLLPARYKSQTLVLVEGATVSSDVIKPMDSSELGQRLASMQQEILSRSRLEPIIRKYNLYPKEVNRASVDDLVARLQKGIEVTPILAMSETHARDLPGFNVSVTLDNPHTAQNVCADITSMFIEDSIQLKLGHGKQTYDFLDQQLAEAKANLDAQNAKLAEFKLHHMGELPDEAQTSVNLLTTMTSQLDAATQSLNRAQQEKTFNEQMLSSQLSAWQATQTGSNPETVDRQLANLQTQLASLQSRYTDDYPDVIKTKNDIAALQKKMNDANSSAVTAAAGKSAHPSIEPPQIQQLRATIRTVDQEIADKAKQQQRIQQQINVIQARIEASPGVEQQFKELTLGYQTAVESFNELQKKRDNSKMSIELDQRQEGEQFRVLDPANLPDKPSFPNRPLFALGGLGGGLGLGLALAFLLELKDTSFKTERDVEFALQLPVLAMVPSIEPASAKGGRGRIAPKGIEAGAGA
jgi:polysaccharide chain length determinant protein (PEP-CTERM system associated)